MLDLDKFIAGMDEEQLTNLRRVIKAAQKYNINPEFVLPMVKAESNFKHVKNPDSGAFGVMQLMPATASSLKVDPNDVDENIEGGMRLLKELSDNKKIGSDPYKVLAGYNASPTTPFLTSGNLDDLPLETLNHMRNVSKYYGGVLPSLNAGEAEPEEPVEEAAKSNGLNPTATTGAPPPPNTRDTYIPPGSSAPDMSDRQLALTGGVLGLTAGATGETAKRGKKILRGVGQILTGNSDAVAPVTRVEPTLNVGAQTAEELASAAQQGENLAQGAQQAAQEGQAGGRGVRGWLAGRTSSAIPVPDELVENVATLKGHGPASASAAEAQHAANVEKLLTMNEPPSRWKPAMPGGKIVVSTAPQTAGPRTYGPAPIKAQAAQTGPFTIGSGEAPIVGGAKAAPSAPVTAPVSTSPLPVTAPVSEGESFLGKMARYGGNAAKVLKPVANIGLSGLSGVLSAQELAEADKLRRMYGWSPEVIFKYMSGAGGALGTIPTAPTRIIGGALQLPELGRQGYNWLHTPATDSGAANYEDFSR